MDSELNMNALKSNKENSNIIKIITETLKLHITENPAFTLCLH